MAKKDAGIFVTNLMDEEEAVGEGSTIVTAPSKMAEQFAAATAAAHAPNS